LLKLKLRRYIKDAQVLRLLDAIIDTSPKQRDAPPPFPGDDLLTPLEHPTGIPIGNLTSQFFANLYLDGFDHWMKESTGASAYLRYVDDMVVLADDKAWLAQLREAVRNRLLAERLHLHPRKTQIQRTRDGLDLLGYRVFSDFIRLRDDNGHRFARRLRAMVRAYQKGAIELADTKPSVVSWIGHAIRADRYWLRRAILRQGAYSSAVRKGVTTIESNPTIDYGSMRRIEAIRSKSLSKEQRPSSTWI
jgi:RNA-directed DNA polymerase